jgi:hypothetical protein
MTTAKKIKKSQTSPSRVLKEVRADFGKALLGAENYYFLSQTALCAKGPFGTCPRESFFREIKKDSN